MQIISNPLRLVKRARSDTVATDWVRLPDEPYAVRFVVRMSAPGERRIGLLRTYWLPFRPIDDFDRLRIEAKVHERRKQFANTWARMHGFAAVELVRSCACC